MPRKARLKVDPGVGENLYEESKERYQHAVARAMAIREQWETEGRPITTMGGATGKAVVAHPLVGMMAQAEQIAAQLAEKLKKRQPGGGAVAVPPIGESPAAKLRRIK